MIIILFHLALKTGEESNNNKKRKCTIKIHTPNLHHLASDNSCSKQELWDTVHGPLQKQVITTSTMGQRCIK